MDGIGEGQISDVNKIKRSPVIKSRLLLCYSVRTCWGRHSLSASPADQKNVLERICKLLLANRTERKNEWNRKFEYY